MDHTGADASTGDPAADGVDHLQRAARELLGAARSFLDVVEEVIEDRDRLSGAATSVVDLVRDGLAAVSGSSVVQPWERSAWADDVGHDRAGPLDDLVHEDLLHDDDPDFGDHESGGDPAGAVDLTDGSADDDADDTPAAPRRRVRRIAVD